MKLMVNDFCIRCQICESLYPALLKLDVDTDIIDVLVDEVPRHLRADAKAAIRDCAVTAISLSKDAAEE